MEATRDEKLEALWSHLDLLHNQVPSMALTQTAITMIQMLDVALHGTAYARPAPPREVWMNLLDEVTARNT